MSQEIETIGGIVAAAREKLSPQIHDYLVGGSGTELTLRRNRGVLESLFIVPRVLRDVSDRCPGTGFFGRPVGLPILMAPVGSIGLLDKAGAAAVAAAASTIPVPVYLSIMASPSLEEVASVAADAPLVLQLYMRGDRTWLDETIHRAEVAGCVALCLTVDTAVYSRRDRDLANGFISSSAIDRPNLPDRKEAQITAEQARLTWDDVAWLASRTRLPLILKGVLATEDALRAAEIGCKAVYLSNHGGRQLDGAVSALERLPAVRAALGPNMQIYVDGGFESGSDILKALALGADMIGIGKLQALALAAAGREGVVAMLEILRHEFDIALALSGASGVSDARNIELSSNLAFASSLSGNGQFLPATTWSAHHKQ